MFSERTAVELAPSAFAEVIAAARAAGRVRWDLTGSNPTVVGLPRDDAALARALTRRLAGAYEPEPLGLLEARVAAAERGRARGLSAAPEQMLITASTSEAYGQLFKLLCDPGDEVLVPAPSYPLLEHLAAFEGVRLARYALLYDGGWHIDTESLRAARGPRSRAVVVVTPNNPTGSYLHEDDRQALLGLGLPVIADEVFAEYPLELPVAPPSAGADARLLTFSMAGLSKTAALPHWKLAWTAVTGPASDVERAMERLELLADAALSVPTFTQAALGDLLAAAEPTRAALHVRVRNNLGALRAALTGSAATVLRAEGGWSAVLRLPAIRDDDGWARALLARGLLTQPGWLYDFGEAPHLVLSLIGDEASFAEAARALADAVDALLA